jgi:hypothetical protein
MPEEFNHDEHPLSHKPWAVWSVIFVVLFFSIFWYYQHTQQNNSIEVTPPLSVRQAPVVAEKRSPEQPLSLTDLQAAALNTAIPDYAKNF